MKEKMKSLAGTTPYGYRRKDGFLVEDPSEKNVILQMIQLKEEKNYSLRKIAAFLNENFIPSKQNGLWYSNVIGDILERQPEKALTLDDHICVNGDER